jgi:hypothetical protein
MNGYVFAAGESRTVFTPRDPGNNPLNFDKSNPVWVKMNKERLGRDLLLLDARRMLDLARRRADTQHHCRNPSLPESVGDYFPAVVSAQSAT